MLATGLFTFSMTWILSAQITLTNRLPQHKPHPQRQPQAQVMSSNNTAFDAFRNSHSLDVGTHPQCLHAVFHQRGCESREQSTRATLNVKVYCRETQLFPVNLSFFFFKPWAAITSPIHIPLRGVTEGWESFTHGVRRIHQPCVLFFFFLLLSFLTCFFFQRRRAV